MERVPPELDAHAVSLDHLHFISRRAGADAPAEGQRVGVAPGGPAYGGGWIRRGAGGVLSVQGGRDGRRCEPGLDSFTRHQVSPRGGRHQSDAGFADRPGGHRGHFVFLEHRASGEGILRVLPRAHRRRLWRVPELRSVPAVRVLRNRHHSEILSDRHLGLDPEGIRRDEAGALLVRRQRDGAGRLDRGVRGVRRAHD